jgi:hypothetical protein
MQIKHAVDRHKIKARGYEDDCVASDWASPSHYEDKSDSLQQVAKKKDEEKHSESIPGLPEFSWQSIEFGLQGCVDA